jgi:hypothetical protein
MTSRITSAGATVERPIPILPESTVRARSAELHAVTIVRPELRGRVALAWNAQGSIGSRCARAHTPRRKVLPDLPSARAAV